jgi:Thioredoxin domain
MLKIKIIGTEDTQQKILVLNVKSAVDSLGADAIIIPITDWEDIMNYDIIQTPALVIRNQVLSQGFVPRVSEIQRIIKAFLPNESYVAKAPLIKK